MRHCQICGKKEVRSFNRPHSLHKTKRVVRPNLQRLGNFLVCTRCKRTELNKKLSFV